MKKIGYFEIKEQEGKFLVDSGKSIYLKNHRKFILNKARIQKNFSTLEEAIDFCQKILNKKKVIKNKILKKQSKILYLILMKEIKTNKSFIKVGYTSKKFVLRRFLKEYGYENYRLLSIIRKINSEKAELMENAIKEKIRLIPNIKKFTLLDKDFSGYSECFQIENKKDIIDIFDNIVNSNL